MVDYLVNEAAAVSQRFSCVLCCDDFLHRSDRPSREGSHASGLCVPHSFFGRGTIENLYAIVCGGMIACVAGMLLDEFKELLLPGVVGVGKEPFSKRFQLVHADHFDVLPDRLASILVDLFNIQVLGFYAGRLIPGCNHRPAKSSCRLQAVVHLRQTYPDAARSCDSASGEIAYLK